MRDISVRVSSLVAAAVISLLIAAVAVLSVLVAGARGDLADHDAAAADTRHAEKVATDYAVGASTIDFNNLDTWVGRLKTNAAPTLSTRFDATAPALRELLTPLKWVSTAKPIAAKVLSVTNGAYTVDVFLTINSTNIQNPQGALATVDYSVTVDKNSGWQVTEAGNDKPFPLK
ncbi:hypothetical protein [Nocardia arthritidis]|uniref:Mce-associated membrane protein n=1 Tax=Nocardia arthritidis TaxID=228602 RepID=A0A6G9YIB6_9NOCA|nr:hypothetical protein [Nocardia arthritidis]QIS13045.1 hypothetical protein F5544_25955 [Nocardia arthritidis]